MLVIAKLIHVVQAVFKLAEYFSTGAPGRVLADGEPHLLLQDVPLHPLQVSSETRRGSAATSQTAPRAG